MINEQIRVPINGVCQFISIRSEKTAMPIFFIEGRHDKHVSSDLVESYYSQIKSEKKLVWFEHSCHFPQWSENERFHQLMLHIRKF